MQNGLQCYTYLIGSPLQSDQPFTVLFPEGIPSPSNFLRLLLSNCQLLLSNWQGTLKEKVSVYVREEETQEESSSLENIDEKSTDLSHDRVERTCVREGLPDRGPRKARGWRKNPLYGCMINHTNDGDDIFILQVFFCTHSQKRLCLMSSTWQVFESISKWTCSPPRNLSAKSSVSDRS